MMIHTERWTPFVRGAKRNGDSWSAIYIVTAISSSLGVLGKASQLKHHGSVIFPVLLVAVCCAILLPFFWRLALRFRRILAPLTLLGLVFTSLIIYPKIEKLQTVGRGTDQPACIIVAANAMMSREWPYQREKIWTHNQMSCGPGWVVVQAPVVKLLGYRWDLICLWAVALGVFSFVEGVDNVCGLLALLCLSPGFWLAASNGTDFLPFGIALATLFAASNVVKRNSIIFIIFAALLAQFRLPMLLLPAFFTKQLGRAAALWSTSLAILTQIAFLIWNPASYVLDGPMHVLFKLTQRHFFSTNVVWSSLEIGLPLFLGAALITWWDKRTANNLGLIAYLYAMLLPPAILDFFHKIGLYSGMLKALEFWEGGMWLTACVPIVGVILVRLYIVPQLRVQQQLTEVSRVSAA